MSFCNENSIIPIARNEFYTGDSLCQKTFMENYKKCVNTGRHITVKMVMWLPVFCVYEGDHMRKSALALILHLCHTSIRRDGGSRLFLVQVKLLQVIF